jgi:hypothetical protein
MYRAYGSWFTPMKSRSCPMKPRKISVAARVKVLGPFVSQEMLGKRRPDERDSRERLPSR